MAEVAYKDLKEGRTNLNTLNPKAQGFLYKQIFTPQGSNSGIDILTIDNGALRFTVLYSRGMDIGQIWYKGKQIGWDRDISFLKHPNDVKLNATANHISEGPLEGFGWLQGFYAMDTMVGPAHFGGPCQDKESNEKFTLHDRNSYSVTNMDKASIEVNNKDIIVSGAVPVHYQGANPRFLRKTIIQTGYGQNSLIRQDETQNVSSKSQIIDDGHHIQFGGALLWDGSKYVVSANLNARDDEAAKWIAAALNVPAPTPEYFAERCYFLHPNAIQGSVDGVALSGQSDDITVQMIRTANSDLAGFVAHKISDFKCVTLWQQYGSWQFDGNNQAPIWYTAAIEPANSFPNDRDNKKDELRVLKRNEHRSQMVEIGALEGAPAVISLEQRIDAANSK